MALTHGEKGTFGTPETRRAEFQEANRVMGTDGRILDFPDTGQLVSDGLKLARFKSVMPEIPAHDVRRLFYYMIPKDMLPAIVVDVTDVMDDVRRAIRAYESQMKIWRAENSIIDLLDTVRAYHGIRIGKRFGEAFHSDESLGFDADHFFTV